MFKFAKARPQVLNDLDEYLQLISDEPVLWLEREIRSWNEFSYEELANLIASGNIELINWQQRYAQAVNDKFNPLWLAAIQAGSFASTRGRITIDDSDARVKKFLRTHGAEFVTQLSEESKRAVANVILFGQSENLKPLDIAKLIRPLIGLNAPQTQANLNYRARVLIKLIESGLSPAQAAIRADKSAATYAVKQHKYRAETIVHTELARAYNQGAFDGVRAAVDAKLMPHCEMIWSTAGTNRVCSRCLGLKDVVVGRTDEVGVQIPPLHPRCRCVIIYRENRSNIEMPRRRVAPDGHEIIDKPTYHKLTRSFVKAGGLIIRGEEAARHLKSSGASASYLAGANAAFITDDATISDVLEEMYHARQERAKMFGELSEDLVWLKREIDAQKYLLSVTVKYKIPPEEVAVTEANLKYYENLLEAALNAR